METIGKFIVLAVLFFNCTSLQAAIRAGIDRNDVSLDESVSLKITSDDGKASFEPKFDASDFEVMNQFESSQFSSVYNNGRFENKSEKTVTYILRPLKAGTLKIKNIRNGDERSPDLSVQVSKDSGSGRKSIGGEAPSLKGDAKNFFVKAEVSKYKIFKGEQLIVSYYLYRRTRANLRDVMQYPTFQGFIREDLEMPILSGRPDFEAVSLGGVPFERALLARYALYPIKEGKLKIDSLGIRADYIPKNAGSDDLYEDPFFQFFSQVTPRTGTSKSDPLIIDVIPIPEDGKTPLFSGGVGTFDISAHIDQPIIKTNAPFTLKISIHGKGNASLIEFPTVTWPSSLRFYESQGKSKNLGQGKTEKTFEVVIVPLEKGDLQVPAIEFEFFDPENRSFVRKKTEPISIQVAEGDAQPPQSIPTAPLDDTAPTNQSEPSTWGKLRLNNSLNSESSGSFLGQPWWRWVAWIGLIVFFSFVGLVIYDQVRKRSLLKIALLKSEEDLDKFWVNLQREAQDVSAANASKEFYSNLMEQMIEQIHVVLDEKFKIASRSLPRRELAKLLTLSDEQWNRLSSILEFAEMIRFVGNTELGTQAELQVKAIDIIKSARKICIEIVAKS